jgi:hypothetical protein
MTLKAHPQGVVAQNFAQTEERAYDLRPGARWLVDDAEASRAAAATRHGLEHYS